MKTLFASIAYIILFVALSVQPEDTSNLVLVTGGALLGIFYANALRVVREQS